MGKIVMLNCDWCKAPNVAATSSIAVTNGAGPSDKPLAQLDLCRRCAKRLVRLIRPRKRKGMEEAVPHTKRRMLSPAEVDKRVAAAVAKKKEPFTAKGICKEADVPLQPGADALKRMVKAGKLRSKGRQRGRLLYPPGVRAA